MERWPLRMALIHGDKLFLYATTKDLSWEVDVKRVDIKVMLNQNCEEGTWVEITMSTTLGLAPHYIKKVVVYTSTCEAREKWRKTIFSLKNDPKLVEVVPGSNYDGPSKPYEPRPLIHEPDPAIKG